MYYSVSKIWNIDAGRNESSSANDRLAHNELLNYYFHIIIIHSHYPVFVVY